jgi:4-amino-4-deoxy-L-arabinose transferase-like glycosyltransferase
MGNKHLFLLVLIIILGFAVRFFQHNVSPPGFTADEAVFGYNAYSLLKTGKDEFGASWPVALRAFGDWRPALYSYLAVPFIYYFGLTEMAVRMPSILLGSATIPVVMGIAWILTGNKSITALAGLIFALSPTHILISRFADMSPLSTFFLGMGVMCFLWWKKKTRSVFLLASAVSFSLSALSYHNARVTGPLLLTVLTILNIDLIKKHLTDVAIAISLGIIVLLPLILFMAKSLDLVLHRGKYESFLGQKGYEIRLWNLISANPPGQNPLITRFFYNKPKLIFEEFSEKYFSHFSSSFLFLSGDPNERFKTPGSGVYNMLLFILIPVGFVATLRDKKFAILPVWWLISPLISAIGIFTPNSLHTLDASIPAAVMTGIGAKKLSGKFPGATKTLLLTVGVVIFSVSLSSFLKGYFYTIPRSNELRWNWYPQTKELTGWINNLTGKDKVIVIGNRSMHEFILFNNSVDPAYYQRSVKVSDIPDENGFERVEGFGRFRFDGKLDQATIQGGDWIVFDKDSLPQNLTWKTTDCALSNDKPFFELKKQIIDLGQPVYSIYYFPKDQVVSKSDFCASNKSL